MLSLALVLFLVTVAASPSNTANLLGRPSVIASLKQFHGPSHLSIRRPLSSSISLQVRGGGDQGRGDDNNDDGRRGDYQDRGRNNYEGDRGGHGGSGGDYGYPNDGRSSGDYYGYQGDDRGRSGDYYGDGRADGYYGDDRYSQGGYYDDKGSSSQGFSSARVKQSMSGMSSIVKHGNKRIGASLLGLGAMFTMMGITSFFNKNLLRLGNLFFISGVPMTIGPGRTAGYFFQPKKSRATGCLCLGIFLVFVGHPVLGIALEGFGLLNLFGNMFPLALAVLRQMPILGTILGNGGGGKARRKRPQEKQDRYYDEPYRDNDDGSGYY